MDTPLRSYTTKFIEILKHYPEMHFIMGPRQVGKTTITTQMQNFFDRSLYLNWDVEDHRELILKGQRFIEDIFPSHQLGPKPLIIFDEIHKYKPWKNFLKGFYDLYKNHYHVVVSGSAHLNVFQKGGDSLMGRYMPFSIHPFSVGELGPKALDDMLRTPYNGGDMLNTLMDFGGFPAPFLAKDPTFYERWRRTRRSQLFREDIRDMTSIHDMAQLEVCAQLLTHQSGQIVNRSAISKKLQVTIQTIGRWLEVLKQFFYCFTLPPWSRNIPHSLIKEPKVFIHDWSLVKDKGARFENLVGCHVKKSVDYWNDMGKGTFDVFFLRDKQQREVDFVVTRDNEPWFLVEVKCKETKLSPALSYFKEKTKAPYAFQVVKDLPYVEADCFEKPGTFVVPASTFLSQLV
jgi:hypothetical protein